MPPALAVMPPMPPMPPMSPIRTAAANDANAAPIRPRGEPLSTQVGGMLVRADRCRSHSRPCRRS
eukprot:10374379-Heterocapsa_arctica.AAC.1